MCSGQLIRATERLPTCTAICLIRLGGLITRGLELNRLGGLVRMAADPTRLIRPSRPRCCMAGDPTRGPQGLDAPCVRLHFPVSWPGKDGNEGGRISKELKQSPRTGRSLVNKNTYLLGPGLDLI
jgi:hypothetical protein